MTIIISIQFFLMFLIILSFIIRIITLNINYKRYKKSVKKFEITCDKIYSFMNNGDNSIKYEKKIESYFKIISRNKPFVTGYNWMKKSSIQTEELNKNLYFEFKDIIPEFIQIDREEKLKRILPKNYFGGLKKTLYLCIQIKNKLKGTFKI